MQKKRVRFDMTKPRSREPWTPQDEEKLAELSKTLPDEEIAKGLGRTLAAIRVHRHRVRTD